MSSATPDATIDATTGVATAWDPNANDYVYALAVSGGTVYAGGYFTSIGGQPRNYIAALDAASGAATDWDANANDYVYALTEMGRLKQEPVTQGELDSAREQMKGKLLMSLESSDSLMTRLAKNVIYLGRPQPMENVLAGFDAVRVEDVAEIAARLFDGECLNLEVMGRTGGLGLTADSLRL